MVGILLGDFPRQLCERECVITGFLTFTLLLLATRDSSSVRRRLLKTRKVKSKEMSYSYTASFHSEVSVLEPRSNGEVGG
jgi:hypothetical protein